MTLYFYLTTEINRVDFGKVRVYEGNELQNNSKLTYSIYRGLYTTNVQYEIDA